MISSFDWKDFGKILKKNAQAFRQDGTNTYRVYDRNLGVLPVTVEVFADKVKVTDYGDEPLCEEDCENLIRTCRSMLYLNDDSNVYYSYRAKRTGREQHLKNDAEAQTTVVYENGFSFEVNLTSYTDCGLFLDHSKTRAFIADRSAGCDVLNLFSYTGSFSVYAAGGGAAKVTSVDLSKTYTDWALRNLKLNSFTGENYECVTCDAHEYVKRAIEEGKKYDIIIFDVPSFSNSHKAEDFNVEKDWVKWIKMLVRILKKEGFILFSNNLAGFKMDKRRLKGLNVTEITEICRAPGFTKKSAGYSRSWIMEFKDKDLAIDWSHEEEQPKRPSYMKDRERKPRQQQGHRFNDRPRREYDGRDGYRPRRESEYGRNEYKPRREYETRDDYRSRRESEYGRNEYKPRREYETRDDYRPRRESEYGRNEYKPRREYDARDSYRPRREPESREDRFSGYHERRQSSRSSHKVKPYGFDSFKPARSREDSSDFFWNDENLDNKKNK